MRNIFAKKFHATSCLFIQNKMEHLSWFSFFLNFFIAKRNSRIDVIFVSCPLGISRMLLSIINDTTPHLAGKVYVTYQMCTHTKSGIGYISAKNHQWEFHTFKLLFYICAAASCLSPLITACMLYIPMSKPIPLFICIYTGPSI